MNTTSARPPHPDEPGLRPIRPDDAADVLAAFASATDMARQGGATPVVFLTKKLE